ncbi:MAG TPA: class I SAM-dependent methyltransferase [Acetobacteraceae bacterium]|nr:class I SAM-dependent methyltransferase [Acetobacteraceae bacterium]
MPVSADKLEREREAFAGDGALAASRGRIQTILDHVYHGPNGIRAQRDFEAIVAAHAPGRSVLEVGCGTGWNCGRILRLGAREVVGIDISDDLIARAQAHAGPHVTIYRHDVHQPIEGRFGLVLGRAVLHHVDYQTVLARLYADNLEPGGLMAFMEPLGSGLVSRAYWRFGTRFHTEDERPFYRSDLHWLRARFPGFEFRPYGYLSFPLSVVSAALFEQPINPLSRATDAIDQWLADHAPWLGPNFRTSIFVIRKPA